MWLSMTSDNATWRAFCCHFIRRMKLQPIHPTASIGVVYISVSIIDKDTTSWFVVFAGMRELQCTAPTIGLMYVDSNAIAFRRSQECREYVLINVIVNAQMLRSRWHQLAKLTCQAESSSSDQHAGSVRPLEAKVHLQMYSNGLWGDFWCINRLAVGGL